MGGGGGVYNNAEETARDYRRLPDVLTRVEVIGDSLSVINQVGERHGVTPYFNGETIRVGCVGLSEDAWVKLKQQVDEAVVAGKKNIDRLNESVKHKKK